MEIVAGTAARVGVFSAAGGNFWSDRIGSDRDRTARRLFMASIFYLPVVMAGLMIEQLGSR